MLSFKIEKNYSKFEKIVLFVCICRLNSQLNFSFMSILEKKHKNFSLRNPSLLCRTWSVYWSVPILKSVPPQKIPGCAPVTSSLSFHTNVKVFVNLPIYRKLIHDNISHMFWKPRIFCLVLFWMRYKIAFTYKYLHQKLWLALLWRRYISFLFINIDIVIFVSVILKKIQITFIHNHLRYCKIPKGYISNSSNISDYVNIVEITST